MAVITSDTFNNIHFSQLQLVGADQFSLDCLGEVITLQYFGWLVDISTNISKNESISHIKVLYSSV